jgi:hypothetical protein
MSICYEIEVLSVTELMDLFIANIYFRKRDCLPLGTNRHWLKNSQTYYIDHKIFI